MAIQVRSCPSKGVARCRGGSGMLRGSGDSLTRGSIGENNLGDFFVFLICYCIFGVCWGLYYSKMAN